MRKLIVIGNCVAERLSLLLTGLLERQELFCPSLAEKWEVLQTGPIHNLAKKDYAILAEKAASCDLVFSQPLFSFGPCNTEMLRKRVGSRLALFSAPNFEAYFPDVMDIRPYCEQEKFQPPMEWHSSIIVKCKAAGIPIDGLEEIYVNHPLFQPVKMAAAVRKSLAVYEGRETGVEIGTMRVLLEHYALEPMFYTWNHPGDRIFKTLLSGMFAKLGLDAAGRDEALRHVPWLDPSGDIHGWNHWGFGFNAWPVITRNHGFFSFAGREWFRVKGERKSITECAWEYYRYYDAHPGIFAQALAASAALS